jgi:hypothetical protein
MQTEWRVARFGPTTPTRANRPFDASVDPTEARNVTVRRFGRSDDARSVAGFSPDNCAVSRGRKCAQRSSGTRR